MKKLLLGIAASAIAFGAFAAVSPKRIPTQGFLLSTDGVESNYTKSPSRASTADGYDLEFCGDVYTWMTGLNGLALNIKYVCYIPYSAEIATKLAGNKITEVTFSSYLASADTKPGTIFVAESMDADPVTSTAITVKAVEDTKNPQPQTEAFAEPYTIKAGQEFYIGYTVEKTTNKDYPVGLSDTGNEAFAGYAVLYTAKGEVKNEISIAEQDYYLFLSAKTEGSNRTLNDLVTIENIEIGDVTLPTLDADQPATAFIGVTNLGDNTISSVECEFSVNGAPSVSQTVAANVAPAESKFIPVQTPNIPVGRSSVAVKVTKINSEPYDVAAEIPVIAVTADNRFPRVNVCEEGTGTWCGWCPWGIETFEYMKATYPDNFIGIAIHAANGDPFESASYLPMAYVFPGFPECIINRDGGWMLQPIKYLFEIYYPEVFEKAVAAAKIGLDVDYTDGVLTATATSQFGFSDANADYSVAFAITEDGLTGTQTNNFAGMNAAQQESYLAPEGWAEKTDPVQWTYNDVARDIVDCWGIEGSIPSTVVEGQKYVYSAEVPVTEVTDINNTTVVAMLIDNITGVIMNAAKVEAKNYTASVDNIVADKASLVKVYGESGRIIINGDYNTARVFATNGAMTAKGLGNSSIKAAKGLYIVVVDGVSHKVIVR